MNFSNALTFFGGCAIIKKIISMGGIAMEAVQVQNAIRVNMRGFLPKARKKFVLTENKTGNAEFTVTLIHGEFVEHTVVFRGRMTTERDEDGREFQVGDFFGA